MWLRNTLTYILSHNAGRATRWARARGIHPVSVPYKYSSKRHYDYPQFLVIPKDPGLLSHYLGFLAVIKSYPIRIPIGMLIHNVIYHRVKVQ